MILVRIGAALAVAFLLALIAGSVGISPIYVQTVERHFSFLRPPFSSFTVGVVYFGPSFGLGSVATAIAAAYVARRSTLLAALTSVVIAPVAYVLFQWAYVAFLRAAVEVAMHNSAFHVFLSAVVGVIFGFGFALIIAVTSRSPRTAP